MPKQITNPSNKSPFGNASSDRKDNGQLNRVLPSTRRRLAAKMALICTYGDLRNPSDPILT